MRTRIVDRKAHAKDFPLKSGELYGDILTTVIISMLSGIILFDCFQNIATYNTFIIITGVLVVIMLMLLVYTSWAYYIIPAIRSYEETYGSSKCGEKWKERVLESKK
jgi:hypothetical protein